MKLIRTVIRTSEVEEVRAALGALNIGRLSLIQLDDSHRRILVELVVDDQTVAPALQQLARSIDRYPTSGRVVVVPLE